MFGLFISLLLFSATSTGQLLADGAIEDIGSVESFDPRASDDAIIPEVTGLLEELTDGATKSFDGTEKAIRRSKPRARAAPGPRSYRARGLTR